MGCQKWLCLCAPIFLTCLWRCRWCEVLDFGSHEENAAEVNLDAAYETRDLVKGPAEPRGVGARGSLAHTGTFHRNHTHSNINPFPGVARVSKEVKLNEKFESVS